MTDTNWTDEMLLDAIRQGGPPREAALQAIYQKPGLRETVIRHVLDRGGSRDDAMDVFQETLVLFDRNLRLGRFEGRSSLATYFVGIARWNWQAQRRRRGRMAQWQDEHYEGQVESPEADVLRAEHRSWLEAVLGRIGERCRELLRLYQLDYSMEEITAAMQYANADVAKKEAYRCRMRFRELLEQQPAWNDLRNPY
ncbi:MAG: sigma-70 family RNA polymerase sigma factor [Saprospiraceae bacterium]|nr:sigma-70 family RNA polymerase sigma factor [Saprospiraceae bacterium]